MWLVVAILAAAPKPVPVDFRCDRMRMTATPRSVTCEQNVVVRRGDWLLCCEIFEGTQDKTGAWRRLTCSQNVRAQRNAERMWSGRAVYVFETSDLILTGDPLLQRPTSLLSGERIILDTSRDQAHIERPRGKLQDHDVAIEPLAPGLPEQCPIGQRP